MQRGHPSAAMAGRKVPATRWWCVGLGLLLASCAARPAAVTATATPVIAARLHEGVVVAVRQISIDDAGGSRPGVDAVLAALQAPASTGAIAGQEIVVLQNDGGAVSIIDRHPLAPGFAVGDRVAIAEGGTTALVHGD